MMQSTLQISLAVGLALYFILILAFLKNKALTLKYTLLWLLAGVVMLFFLIYPEALFVLTRAIGIESFLYTLNRPRD